MQNETITQHHRLQEALDTGAVERGIRLLERARTSMERSLLTDPVAPALLLCLAEWVDAGYRDAAYLHGLLSRFSGEQRKALCMEDYFSIRLAEAFCALGEEDAERAIAILKFVLGAEDGVLPLRCRSLAHFWLGRAHRRKGEYEIAREHLVRSRELADTLPRGRLLAAQIQVQESWVLFQLGLADDAWTLLDRAEGALRQTGFAIALGNIGSARGRMVRRAGRYADALEHFVAAIAIFREAHPNHPNLARTLANSAYVKRLLMLQLRKAIDRGASTRRAGSRQGTDVAGLRSRYQELYRSALAELERAKEIYLLHNVHVGIGAVLQNSGYLHLDTGEVDRAGEEAESAYALAVERHDLILMARARLLQSAVHNAHVEEQLGEEVDVAAQASQARRYCDEAIALARQTQNRRLLANAYIRSGMTAANDFFHDWPLAKECVANASEMLVRQDGDHLVEELAMLKSKVMQSAGIEDTLRAWSEGMTGNKSFQQIGEEFAELVIPRVWVKEGRRVSRVAEKLAISPKKVRRVLRNTGWMK